MSSVEAAQRIIRGIWCEYTVDETIRRVVEKALTILSSNIYNKTTHFLLELIQNADDNKYQSEMPTLTFTYKKGSLRVDCNEVGFSEANVRAICKIGESTKAGNGDSTCYIGEKGIGFKAVFRVADVVYISSGSFSFKFDKAERVGLIAPIWSDFPEETIPGHTSFYLQLAKNPKEEDEIVRDLEELDPRVLIFLRQLRQIDVNISHGDGHVFSRKLQRRDTSDRGSLRTILYQDATCSEYVKINHQVDELPADKRRQGCSKSEIVMAFPLSDLGRPPPENIQYAYAFLPIKDYGFEFLVQGDFLLPASRQDIDECSWNYALLKGSADAFVKAVDYFNSGLLKYHWPHYLPRKDTTGIFKNMVKRIYDKLAVKPILESCDKAMCMPSSLSCVPRTQLSYTTGEPFTLFSETKAEYLALEYPEWEVGPISNLEVGTIDAKGFLRDLQRMISSRRDDVLFHQRDQHWHSELAKVLGVLAADQDHLESMQELAIIPLKSGGWISSRDKLIFFGNVNGFDIPTTITFEIVHPDAEGDHSRRNLFNQLGVQPCDTSKICHLIMTLHNAETLEGAVTGDQLLSHAVFMYRAGFSPPTGTYLWFATTGDCPPTKGSCLYMHGKSNSSTAVGRITLELQKGFPFIHGDYLKAIPNDENWPVWLQKSCGISTLPRIHSSLPKSPTIFHLSPEFDFLFKSCSLSDVLVLMKDNWHKYYSEWVEDIGPEAHNPTLRESRKKVRYTIGAKKVDYPKGCAHLRMTILPKIDSRMDQCDYVPKLDIEDARNPQWALLENFGVVIRRNIHYYLRCLECMQGHELKKETVAYVYLQIKMNFSDNESLIWNAFHEQKLIYTKYGTPTRQMRWITSKECIENSLEIEGEYRGCNTLFRRLLTNTEGEIHSLIAAMNKIMASTELRDILQLFVNINQTLTRLNSEDVEKAVGLLQRKPIFPVTKGQSNKEFNGLEPFNSKNSPWFIADRHHLRDSFLGHAHILAFAVEDLQSIEKLLNFLELGPRKLSNLVNIKSRPPNDIHIFLDRQYTDFLRARSPYITSLIPKLKLDKDDIALQLKQVKVGIAVPIIRLYTFTYGGLPFSSESNDGEVAFSVKESHLEIYMTEDSVKSRAPLELVSLIVDHCGIVNQVHRDLVHVALNEDNFKQLRRVFHREGFHIPESDAEGFSNPNDPVGGYAALSSYTPINTSQSAGELTFLDDSLMSKFKHISLIDAPKHGVDGFDRRLPAKVVQGSDRFLFRNDMSDPTADFRIVLQKLPAHNQYLGELMISKLFEQHLGATYQPSTHWTSPLRYRAGHAIFDGSRATHASFTMMNEQVIRKSTEFLVQLGYKDATKWKNHSPIYHFDIVIASEGRNSDFSWTTTQFERMRKLRMNNKSRDNPRNVLVLARISSIYSDPRFDFFVDPWRFFISDKFILRGEWDLTATIVDNDHNKDDSHQDSRYHSRPLEEERLPPHISQSTLAPFMQESQYWHTGAEMNQRTQPQQSGGGFDRWQRYGIQEGPTQPQGGSSMSVACASLPLNTWGQDLIPSQQFLHSGNFQTHAHSTTNQASALNQVWQTQLGQYLGVSGERSQTPWTNELQMRQNGCLWPEDVLYHPGHSWNMGMGYRYASDMPGNLVNGHADSNPQLAVPLTRPSPIERPSMNPVMVKFPINSGESGSEFLYSYRRLDSSENIRLITLYPGDGDTRLGGVVFQVPLQDAGVFQAVSYTWGKSELTHSVWTPEGIVKITSSLQSALRSLRHHRDPLILWVDAVCINQNDAEEKKTQIRLMPRVFLHASCVLGCLRNEDDNNAAMETLMQIQARDAFVTSGEEWPQGLAEIPPRWTEKSIPSADDQIWTEINALFAQPWFRRAWVIQEVVVAFSVRLICGKWMVDWNDLFHAVKVIVRESKASSLPRSSTLVEPEWGSFLKLAKMREMEARQFRLPLLDLLEYFRYAESTLRRDRFFALLGLAIDGNDEGFKLDYGLSFKGIVRDYAGAFIKKDKVMDLLHRAGISEKHPWLPSWIPDWTIVKQSSLRSLRSRGMPCEASRHSAPRFELEEGSDELRVHGIYVDTIEAVSNAINVLDQLRSYLKEVDKMVDSMVPSKPYGYRAQLKWMVPIAGAWRPKAVSSENTGPDMQASYKALRDYLTREARPIPSITAPQQVYGSSADGTDAESLYVQSQNYIFALQDNLIGWRFVVTEKKYFGVVPPQVQTGDIVSIIDGGATPFIIRRSENEAFRLVGECYIHGIMKGESEPLPGTIEEIIRLY